METRCPQCSHELVWNGRYYCASCDVNYTKIAHCPDCSAELEKLQACGAANYFCHSCNELKSKSRVQIEFAKLK
ncbi:zinc ribbon domain-containing protein [Vibrio metschnikovii]|nr:zinc ribbon domain-containing protein [Vibrio metschnikovii]